MLDGNVRFLKDKGLFELINGCGQDEKIRFEGDKLLYGDVELDLKAEIRDNVRSIDTIFLHGFGFGNTLESLKEKFPKTVIVVLETNPCILKEVFSRRDLSGVLDDRVIIAILPKGKEESIIENIVSILGRRLQWGNAVQFTTPGYSEVDFYNRKEIGVLLNKHLLPIIVNRNTLLARSEKIFENSIKNIPDMVRWGDSEYFLDAFKGRPAIIVASGPSLSKNIKLLKDVKDRAVIIAVDSVLSVLEKEGVKPDVVCGVDYQEINQLKYTPLLKNKQKSDYVYVASDGVEYLLPKIFNMSFFEYSSGSVVSLYKDLFKERKKRHFSINAVTHLAIQLAYIMGCDPVIFVGQDWAYSYGKEHAEGASVDADLPENVIWVKGNYETKVPTDSNLYSGLKYVEDIIKSTRNEGISYINATEGGAYIEGTQVLTFKYAMEKFIKESIKKDILFIPVEPKYDEFIRRTQQIRDRLGEIIKKATRALAINAKVLKKWVRNKSTDEIRKDVDYVNQLNDEITFDKIFSATVPNFFFKDFYSFYQEEIDIEGQDTKKRIEQSIKYFTLIKEKTVETKKYIDELLEFLKLENSYTGKPERFFKDRDRVLRLAELYFNFKDLYRGIEFVDRAIEIFGDDAMFYYWKAKYCTLNRFMHKEALENFKKALELDPSFKKAKFDYEVEKNMVKSHMILAKQAAEKKDFTTAKRIITRAIDYEPDNELLRSWKNVIEKLAKVSKNAQRQNLLFEQLQLEGDVFDEYKEAIEFVKRERFDEAYEKLIQLYDKYGSFGDIPFLLGSISIDKGKLDEAEKYLNEALELIPYQPLVYLALGKLYLMKGDYLLAKENLEKAISMNPDLKSGVLDTLGNLYYEFGEYEKAFKAFEEYLQYSDDKIKTLTKLALCYKEMGMVNEYNMLMEKIKSITGAN